MPRAAREHAEGFCYHTYNRGLRKQDIFGDDDDRHRFLWFVGYASRRLGVEVHSYSLLGNHFHLVIHCPKGNVSEFMHRLTTMYSQYFNQRYELDGPLFKGRFGSKPIASDEAFLATVVYVSANALKHQLVEHASHHRWSSYRTLADGRIGPKWLRTAKVLELINGDRKLFAQMAAQVSSKPKIGLRDVEQVAGRIITGPDAAALTLLAAVDVARLELGEIADWADISEGAARTRLSRSREKCRVDQSFAEAFEQTRSRLLLL